MHLKLVYLYVNKRWYLSKLKTKLFLLITWISVKFRNKLKKINQVQKSQRKSKYVIFTNYFKNNNIRILLIFFRQKILCVTHFILVFYTQKLFLIYSRCSYIGANIYFFTHKKHTTRTQIATELKNMSCLHDHSCEEHDCSTDWSLYKHIDLSKVPLSFSLCIRFTWKF